MPGLAQNLAALDLVSLNTTEQRTDVVASLSIVKNLAEHLDTGNNGFSSLVGQTDDLNFVANLQLYRAQLYR